MHYYQRVGFLAVLCTGINYDSYDYEYPPNFRTYLLLHLEYLTISKLTRNLWSN